MPREQIGKREKKLRIRSTNKAGKIETNEMYSAGFGSISGVLDDSAPIESVSGIGKNKANKLRSLGVNNVGDLKRYEQFEGIPIRRTKAGKIVDSVLVTDERKGIFKQTNKPITPKKQERVEKASFNARKTVINNRLNKSSANAKKVLERRKKVSNIQSKYKEILRERDEKSSKRYDSRKDALDKKIKELERTGKKDYWEIQKFEEKKSHDINRDYEYSDLSTQEMRDMMSSINKDFKDANVDPIPFSKSDFAQKTRSGLWSDIDRTIQYEYYNTTSVDKAKIIVDQMESESQRDKLSKNWTKREFVFVDQVRLMAKAQKSYKIEFDKISSQIDSAKTLDELNTIKIKSNKLNSEFEENNLLKIKELSRIQKDIRSDYETAYIDDRAYTLNQYSDAILRNPNISVGISSKLDQTNKFDKHKEIITDKRGKQEVLTKLNSKDLMIFPKTIGRASSNNYIKISANGGFLYFYKTDKKTTKISKNTYDKALKEVIDHYNAIDPSLSGITSEHTVNYDSVLLDIKTTDFIPDKYQNEIGYKFIAQFPDISIGDHGTDKSVKYLLAEQSSVGLSTQYEFDKLNGFSYSNFDLYENANFKEYEKDILNYKIKEKVKNKTRESQLWFGNDTAYDLDYVKGIAGMLGFKVKNNDYRPLFEKLLEDEKLMVKVGASYPMVVKVTNNRYVLIAPLETGEDVDEF